MISTVYIVLTFTLLFLHTLCNDENDGTLLGYMMTCLDFMKKKVVRTYTLSGWSSEQVIKLVWPNVFNYVDRMQFTLSKSSKTLIFLVV